MLPLIVGNIIVWGIHYYISQADKAAAKHKGPCFKGCDILYDEDLLYRERTVPCPSGGCRVPIKQWDEDLTCENCPDEMTEEKSLQAKLREAIDRPGLHHEITEEEALVPEEIWANGRFFDPLSKSDFQDFIEMTNRYTLRQEWNSVPFPDGQFQMRVDILRMKGYNGFAAEKIVADGENPYDYPDLIDRE